MNPKKYISFLVVLVTLLACAPGFAATYTHDNANRLTSIDYGDGTTITYTYDANGNMTSMSVNDTASPTGTIIINNGAASTSTTSVTLTLSAADNSGTVSQMRFSNDNATWSAWETYSTTKAWTLSDNSGTKTVYAEFKDPSGNISTTASDTITANLVSIDLVMAGVSAPATVNAGQAFSINYTVQNTGTSASNAFDVKFYLTIDPVSTNPSDVLLGQASHTLNAGASSSANYNATMPSNTAPGVYYIRAIVDTGNTNEETNENNNRAVSGTVSVTSGSGVDLVVSAFTAPTSMQTGVSATVSTTVTNQGPGAATNYINVKFYLSANTQWEDTDALLSNYRQISSLAGGASSAGNTSLTIPVNTNAGTYYIIVKADTDDYNYNPESNESNNTAVSGPVTVASGIDLIVSAFTAPSSMQTGVSTTVSTTVTNQGPGSATNYIHIKFYLSSNTQWEDTDVLLSNYRQISSLAGGASSAGNTSLTIPVNTTAGTYYIIAKADTDDYNYNPESNEDNNTAISGPITVTSGIDLILSAFTAPSSMQTGVSATVSTTVTNQGPGTATNYIRVKFYLSANTQWEDTDVLLSNYRQISSLAGGASSAGNTSLTMPVNTTAGTYYVIAKADTDDYNYNPESNEDNNTAISGLITVTSGLDIVVSAFTTPASMQTGVSATVSTTVTNQGPGTTTTVTNVKFYLSANIQWEDTDVLLSNYRQISSLAGGASSTGNTSLTIPVNTNAGTYYIIVKADADDYNPESNEDNNARVSEPIQITSE